MTDDLQPERPIEEGVVTDYPDADRQEGVHMLANQAYDQLAAEDFTREEVFEWASAYVRDVGTGTTDGLVDYIRAREKR